MERTVAGCVLGREDMIIVAIIMLLVAAGIGWAICAAIPQDSYEDHEHKHSEK